MNYQEYYSARNLVTSILNDDLVGPVEENERLAENPVSYYLLGKLYPRNISWISEDDQVEIDNDENTFREEEMIALGTNIYPSAMGVTVCLSEGTKSFNLFVRAAYYEYIEEEKLWGRCPISKTISIDIVQLLQKGKITYQVEKDLETQVLIHKKREADYKITVSLVNNGKSENTSYVNLSRATFFQPEVIITDLSDGYFVELTNRFSSVSDDETKKLELLYHDVKNYALGHGCSVSSKMDNNPIVKTVIIPYFEVFQMKPSRSKSDKVFSMKYLSQVTYDEFRIEILKYTAEYKEWIDFQVKLSEELDSSYTEKACENIEKCRMTLSRIEKAVDILEDETAYRAFKYANKVMYQQRLATMGELKDKEILWYPFQLAFILQEIESFTNPHDSSRKLVDLLWFPTGGGKTEAYLGIAAFAIFYRRLKKNLLGANDDGLVIIMRYTLRLLSLQQFERAAIMICAAELVRLEEKISGKRFDIGLWAGGKLTPNTLKEASDYLDKGRREGISNPVQITKCPWCGSTITEKDYNVSVPSKSMGIRCPNDRCEFHQMDLPIRLIDEDIYAHNPTFLIGTVDKFAQLAFKPQAGELLGAGKECGPDLIIQDELHLISGPLGTITGLYEAAITQITSKNGVRPKIIASTATIRNAEKQIKALYATDFHQFPPQGVSITDSFFARESMREEKPTRKYIGIMPAGTSNSTAFIKVVGALLFATRYLEEAGYSEDVVDSFWTETMYFNNLRELGSAIVRIIDSVQDRFVYLKDTKFSEKYPIKSSINRYTRHQELTSREDSSELANVIQNKLWIKYSKNHDTKPLDFVVASNMISVGVDVARLNNMVVVGQPLKTAEYIQATSRVGRTTPGLVIMLYSVTKSRDRSHYEQFELYHSTLYKYVEATSLTPFSDRARDRALQALYVILVRNNIEALKISPLAFSKDLKELKEIRGYIKNYVETVDPNEVENVMREVSEIENEWVYRITKNPELVYWDYYNSKKGLFKEDYKEKDRFRMMTSMRDVEPSIEVYVEE